MTGSDGVQASRMELLWGNRREAVHPTPCQTAAQTCWAEGWSEPVDAENSFRATLNISSEELPLLSQAPFKAITSKLPPSALHPAQGFNGFKKQNHYFKSGTCYCPRR